MWHGRLIFYLAFCILGAFSVSDAAAQDAARHKFPSEAATVSEFIEACDRDVRFLCEHAMVTAVLNSINKKNATSICIKGDRLRIPVMAWLKAHPETHKMEREEGLYTAYKSLYPCAGVG